MSEDQQNEMIKILFNRMDRLDEHQRQLERESVKTRTTIMIFFLLLEFVASPLLAYIVSCYI